MTTEEITNIAGLRNVGGWENITGKQPEKIFTTPLASILTPTLVSRPRHTIRTLPDNNIPTDYKPKNIRDAFEGRYVECKSKKDKN